MKNRKNQAPREKEISLVKGQGLEMPEHFRKVDLRLAISIPFESCYHS